MQITKERIAMNKFTQYTHDFNSYQILTEPHSAQNKAIWSLAVNLVFENSADFNGYAAAVAHEHILNNIDIDKAQRAIESHYTSERNMNVNKESSALNIICMRAVHILSYKAFTLSPALFANIQNILFENIEYKGSNSIEDSFHKSNHQYVFIGTHKIDKRLCSLIDSEKAFVFDKCSPNQCLEHLALFACDLLSIKTHDFAHRLASLIFVIQYARTFGFNLQHHVSDTNNSLNTIMHKPNALSDKRAEQNLLPIYRFLSTLFLIKARF